MKREIGKERLQMMQKIATIMFFDVLIVCASYLAALWIRFDLIFWNIPEVYLGECMRAMPFWCAVTVLVLYLFRMYHRLWYFFGMVEVERMVEAYLLLAVCYFVGARIMRLDLPRSWYIIGYFFTFLCHTLLRFAYRFLRNIYNWINYRQEADGADRTMVIGAGDAGRILIREMKESKHLHMRICCVIDDNPAKWGRMIEGVPIVGGREDILQKAEEYNVSRIIYAIPAASARDRKEILNICKQSGCRMQTVPGTYQIVNGEADVSTLRAVDISDLLGREQVDINNKDVFRLIEGTVVLVTGGGGSIGSELCRQIAAHSPKSLIIFDVYENNAYDIQQELKRKYPSLKLHVVIGSVRDSQKVFEVFGNFRPDIVYHAAAHKHVPLMEDSPCEAIKNNAVGTYKTAYAAMCHGCRRFVLISTDKAVNPTNIMGASKRLCEMVVQAFDQKVKEGKACEIPQLFTHEVKEAVASLRIKEALDNAGTEFVSVRFGNVLRSNGSVIPLFEKQIAQGGPVTVTHPDIARYFMTIQEAVSLVLQAGIYAHGGEIFVLDMGEPIEIDTLARNLIRLSGYRPDVDIKIVYTGLRPGEKLYEEKLMAEEGLKKTGNDLIHIGCPIPFDTEEFLQNLGCLMDAAYKNDTDIRELVKKVVGTYHSGG